MENLSQNQTTKTDVEIASLPIEFPLQGPYAFSHNSPFDEVKKTFHSFNNNVLLPYANQQIKITGQLKIQNTNSSPRSDIFIKILVTDINGNILMNQEQSWQEFTKNEIRTWAPSTNEFILVPTDGKIKIELICTRVTHYAAGGGGFNWGGTFSILPDSIIYIDKIA